MDGALAVEKNEQHSNSDMSDDDKSRERKIREAIERIYRAYGPDLSAFQRDVQKELLRRSSIDKADAAA